MEEARKRVWDVRLGIIGPLITVAGLLLGVWQFNRGETDRIAQEHQAAVDKDSIEARRKFWLERLDAYRHIAELAGKVVVHFDDKGSDAAIKEFRAAYWGTMVLVEDAGVEKAAVAFYDEIDMVQKGWDTRDGLKYSADALAVACRESLERTAVDPLDAASGGQAQPKAKSP